MVSTELLIDLLLFVRIPLAVLSAYWAYSLYTDARKHKDLFRSARPAERYVYRHTQRTRGLWFLISVLVCVNSLLLLVYAERARVFTSFNGLLIILGILSVVGMARAERGKLLRLRRKRNRQAANTRLP